MLPLHPLQVKEEMNLGPVGWMMLQGLPWNTKFMWMLARKIAIGSMFMLEPLYTFLPKFSKVVTIKLGWQ